MTTTDPAARQDTEMAEIEKAANAFAEGVRMKSAGAYLGGRYAATGEKNYIDARERLLSLIRPIIAERDKLKAECERMREARELDKYGFVMRAALSPQEHGREKG